MRDHAERGHEVFSLLKKSQLSAWSVVITLRVMFRRRRIRVEKSQPKIGIPARLRDLGVTPEQLPLFAEKAFGIKRILRVNPRVPTVADIEGVYRAAY